MYCFRSRRVVRDRGIFGRVNVHWQIYQVFPNDSRYALTSRDFQHTSGALVFNDREPAKDLVLSVLPDDLAEYGENFEVLLYNVTGMWILNSLANSRLSTLMQLLFSFDQDMRVDETHLQTLACQLSCNSCSRLTRT